MERLDHYIEHLRTFSTERDWDQFHTPENIAKSVSIEAGELLFCFDARISKNLLYIVKMVNAYKRQVRSTCVIVSVSGAGKGKYRFKTGDETA